MPLLHRQRSTPERRRKHRSKGKRCAVVSVAHGAPFERSNISHTTHKEKKTMFQYMHYLFNETEIRFYRKYKLFPDELFQQLQNLGFSRESFKPIQKEMDRLFLLQKEESTWTKADCDPFTGSPT